MLEKYFALAEKMHVEKSYEYNQEDTTAGCKKSSDGLKKLVRDVFGLQKPIHKYFICDECGTEYYQAAKPEACEKCGFMGGCLINPSLSQARLMSKRLLGDDYERVISECTKLMQKEPQNETSVMQKIKTFFTEYDETFLKNPRLFLYALAAADEILTTTGIRNKQNSFEEREEQWETTCN